MFTEQQIAQLAAELQQAEQTRTQVAHFSRRFPGMTVEDGYAVSRASQITEPDYGPLRSIAFRFT